MCKNFNDFVAIEYVASYCDGIAKHISVNFSGDNHSKHVCTALEWIQSFGERGCKLLKFQSKKGHSNTGYPLHPGLIIVEEHCIGL